MTFRFWRPSVVGRRALLVGFTRRQAVFCRGYTIRGRIRMPVENEERGAPIADCILNDSLAGVSPSIMS